MGNVLVNGRRGDFVTGNVVFFTRSRVKVKSRLDSVKGLGFSGIKVSLLNRVRAESLEEAFYVLTTKEAIEDGVCEKESGVTSLKSQHS